MRRRAAGTAEHVIGGVGEKQGNKRGEAKLAVMVTGGCIGFLDECAVAMTAGGGPLSGWPSGKE
ncbi:uncharacterized protein K460DRAFT_361154 [Cucurbitaria berberidis CBS 394.84]|uniref:Uncharacterized protein n=1 Tax=Cucurbitaria berberidis CBS 394.84 TaxID=1168544 RepID=A0A9P4GPQ0_9PLEO|nr:uncharacterized protein K460DRAFT_361154 [Cucurbitaria berberidis CBS 394.84]KAF1850348.1 hypothetical protein K460DRAFT_361154 [Cucurbitaria berberidis CBS 394.84]